MRDVRSLDDIQQQLEIFDGRPRRADINLCAIVRDEMFLLPSFFDHYRRLGVQQFLILDDGSSDGTRRFLQDQADCVVLASKLKFGDHIRVVYPDGTKFNDRADPLLKCAIARRFCEDQYAVLVDADEFLILPAQFSRLGEIFSALAQAEIRCVAANMIEFYPRTAGGMLGAARPTSFADLIALYPNFDAAPLLELRAGHPPRTVASTVTHRLFNRRRAGAARLFPSMRRWLRPKPRKFARAEKIPIVAWGHDVWLNGNHATNIAPSDAILLALAHFKFTHDFAARARRAIEWQSHAEQAAKYRSYLAAIDRVDEQGMTLVCETTEAYSGPEQLLQRGLLKWDLDRRQH